MNAAAASPETVAGFTVGQQVWFILHGCVTCGIITEFRPWLTDKTKHRAEIDIVDDLKSSVFADDLFAGEVPALEFQLKETQRYAAYLKSRLKELAKATTAKAAKAAREGGSNV